MKELDPIIRKLSEYYDFDIRYDEEIDIWIIQNKFKNNRDQFNFYWTMADSPACVDSFLDDLRQYFYDEGNRSY